MSTKTTEKLSGRDHLNSLVRNHVRFLENKLLFHRVEQRKLPKETFAWQQTELALSWLTVKIEFWKLLIPNVKHEPRGNQA